MHAYKTTLPRRLMSIVTNLQFAHLQAISKSSRARKLENKYV